MGRWPMALVLNKKLYCISSHSRKYQYSKLSSETTGVVSMHKEQGGELTNYDIRKADVEVVDEIIPGILIPPGLSPNRQTDLYRVVRPFVRTEYQDMTFPPSAD